jgi:hypothetical protein
MKQPDHARGAIGRTSGQDRVVAALMPIMAVVSIAYLIIGLAMPVLPLHVHLDSFIALCLLNAASPKQGEPPISCLQQESRA